MIIWLFVSAVWKMIICLCCMKNVYLSLLFEKCLFVSAVWKMFICLCWLKNVYLSLLVEKCLFVSAVWTMFISLCCMKIFYLSLLYKKCLFVSAVWKMFICLVWIYPSPGGWGGVFGIGIRLKCKFIAQFFKARSKNKNISNSRDK